MSDTAEIKFQGKTYKLKTSEGQIWRSSPNMNKQSSLKNAHSLGGSMIVNLTMKSNVLIFLVEEKDQEEPSEKEIMGNLFG